ncbi:MAG: efflux RND transporter periplasmic adaptor subunit [Planctomycetes bacterium]|nr:efflux RND transporter periplasmic adaptor subunit [Planctomycetota bacterium]
MLRGRDPEALGVIFPATASLELSVMLVQVAASYLALWHALRESQVNEAEARDAAALLELLDRVENAPDLRHASYVLVNEWQEYLGCRRVAVGVRRSGKGRCHLKAVSGIARFDKRSQSAHAIEAAMDEAVLHGDMTVWQPADEEQQCGALAHKTLCSLEDVSSALSMPLRDHEGRTMGVLVVLGMPPAEPSSQTVAFFCAAERSLATALGVMQRLEEGTLARVGRAVGRLWQARKGKVALVAVFLLLAALAVPLPYRVKCDCRLEPVTQRFVAAPFEDTLEKACVKPGDVVAEGDLLARMDGREIRWKRAGAVADQNQAAKKRDAAMAAHDYAEAQIAKLEMERLDLELRLLDHRAENLDIRSPVDGIVTSGDLERVEGAPLVIGQALFEIAPLEKMIVEIAVADDEVSYVRDGQPIVVRLDAYPGKTWQLELSKVKPRSEIRDQENVFIAEATLDNADGLLRPGMKGRARIVTPRRPLGWILFHKPWEYLAGKLCW